MNKNIMKKMLDVLIGSRDEVILEIRVLHMIGWLGAAISIVAASLNFLLGYEIVTVIIPIITGIISISLCAFSLYFKRNKLLYIFGIYLMPFIILPIIWMTSGGILSSVPYYVILYGMFLSFITYTDKKKKLWIVLFLFIFITLVLIELKTPDIFMHNISNEPIVIDFSVSLLFVVFTAYAFMNIVTKEYNINRKKLKVMIKEREEESKRSEQAYLHAQIKPHFLYNALNTIADCCATDAKEAEELLLFFADYLRFTLEFENLNEIVTLDRELSLVKAYIKLEEARFEKLHVDLIIENVGYCTLPPMTLQPLIENAIQHGIREKKYSGNITLHIAKENNGIKVMVTDNGIGIDEKLIENILKKNHQSDSVGLYNINKRLIALFGSGLEIESELGKGTTVSFIMKKN